ncbi:sperm acrosome-associated protein 7 isoform X3 [Tupaia chinensis]|uniref:sperm acrosome-associated protein 7 isoform X3 n=1 Tax=Tupaia chinensis TaxID=246437 RepID=UPI0003C8D074|nr:sperm acrosome-associated protein 7 isoform X3 [Tupaia chinensis]
MAANREVGTPSLILLGTLFLVLLMCCWQEAEPWPMRINSGPSGESLSSLSHLDDNMATTFDEILVQEILDPNRSSWGDTLSPLARFTPKRTKEKKVHFKTNFHNTASGKKEEQLSSGSTDRLSFDEEDRETLYQIKSLSSLEKIIVSLRRALENHLKKKMTMHKNKLGVRQN